MGVHNEVANNIPALSQDCLSLKYNFAFAFSNDMSKTNISRNFIYKGSGYLTTGHMVYVNYKSCPVICRNYRYSVFVLTSKDDTIIEHTSQVGHFTFTGYYHKGFRVSIIPPATVCPEQKTCSLTLFITKPDSTIGLYDNIKSTTRLGPIQIYTRRYKYSKVTSCIYKYLKLK